VVGETLGTWGLAGGPWTALRMTSLVRRQRSAFRSFIQAVDRVVVLCRWVADVLVRNGVPPTKLFLSRHGFARPPVQTPREHVDADGRRLRIAFLGRLHPTKGADTLVRAIRLLPGAPLELDLFGIMQDSASRAYACSLRELAGDDARIRILEPVSSTDVPSRLAAYDVVAVPSRWLETGPLVVLEAFAAGVPVLGSRLGGLLELVNDGVDGLLLDTDCAEAWAAAFRRLLDEPRLLPGLRAGVRPPRQIDAVADDMLRMYRELVHG
jgi:glycosyltransferase involved in cell wall biosynthesis